MPETQKIYFFHKDGLFIRYNRENGDFEIYNEKKENVFERMKKFYTSEEEIHAILKNEVMNAFAYGTPITETEYTTHKSPLSS